MGFGGDVLRIQHRHRRRRRVSKQASKQAKVPGSPFHRLVVSHPARHLTSSHRPVTHRHQATNRAHPKKERKKKTLTKPHHKQIGVHRDCFGCGRTCEECKGKYIRTCRFCRAEYCVIDNEGSSETEVGIGRAVFRGDHVADFSAC